MTIFYLLNNEGFFISGITAMGEHMILQEGSSRKKKRKEKSLSLVGGRLLWKRVAVHTLTVLGADLGSILAYFLPER